MSELAQLAALLREKNDLDNKIVEIVGRPAQIGHVGEFIASRIFDIELHASASHKGSDGFFRSGSLASASANIKWYAKHEGVLDINVEAVPDYYLVLTGPTPAEWNSRGRGRPWLIDKVFLFDAPKLISDLQTTGVRVGVASGVRVAFWGAAELYPRPNNSTLELDEQQRAMLAMFSIAGLMST